MTTASDKSPDPETMRARLETDGYVIIPALFSPDEIGRLRSTVSGFFKTRGVIFNLGQTQPNAAIECEGLGWLFSDPKVVGLFQSIYDTKNLLFTGHCDIHKDMFSSWHKDTGASDAYFDEDCFVPDCRVYKMAVYLQDHHDGHGLTVIPGSHRRRVWGKNDAEGVSVRSRAGDAVVFDVRLDHHGRLPNSLEKFLLRTSRVSKRLLGTVFPAFRKPGDLPPIYALRRLLAHLTGQSMRMNVFFTFGPPNRFSRQFARTNMDRQLAQYDGGAVGAYPPGLVDRLKAQGVEVYMGEPATHD